MLVIPAIDIKEGRCVRLYQGDFSRVTAYADDPVHVALRWQEEGASMLHVVDLDGALAGEPRNLAVVKAILERVTIPVQVGGGIRNLPTLRAVLDLGVARAVLGTAAVRDRDFLAKAIALGKFRSHLGIKGERNKERVLVSIDARDGMVAVEGWKRTEAMQATDLAKQLTAMGLTRAIYTDIGRDGTLTEPNYGDIGEMVQLAGMAIIASGGIAEIDHIKRLRELGVEGVIIGKALYSGRISLADAIAAGLGEG